MGSPGRSSTFQGSSHQRPLPVAEARAVGSDDLVTRTEEGCADPRANVAVAPEFGFAGTFWVKFVLQDGQEGGRGGHVGDCQQAGSDQEKSLMFVYKPQHQLK